MFGTVQPRFVVPGGVVEFVERRPVGDRQWRGSLDRRIGTGVAVPRGPIPTHRRILVVDAHHRDRLQVLVPFCFSVFLFFLILKDFCRCLTDFSQLYLLHWVFRNCSQCRRCTPSYRALPHNYPRGSCSGRTALCESVLNNNWVSVPTGSEDFGVSAVFYRTNNVVPFKVHLDSLKHVHFFGPLFKKYL